MSLRIRRYLGEEEGHVIKKETYSSPSAAHERAMKLERKGAYRVVVTPKGGKQVVASYWRSEADAEKGMKR